MRTPKNILMHEFIGLHCKVVAASNRHSVGIEGKIIDETMKTIIIRTAKNRKAVAKKGATFRMDLGKQKVDIDGDFIAVRPEDRIKKKFKKW